MTIFLSLRQVGYQYVIQNLHEVIVTKNPAQLIVSDVRFFYYDFWYTCYFRKLSLYIYMHRMQYILATLNFQTGFVDAYL